MQKRDATSPALLKTAVHCAVAFQLGLEPKVELSSPQAEIDELSNTLKNLGVEKPEEKTAAILSYACAASDYIAAHDVVLSVTKYDAQRMRILRNLGLRSSRGLQLWPPTSQTLITRLGGRWSEAMVACGMTVTSGVSIGHANMRFTAADHAAAIRKYVEERKTQNLTISYSGYVTWAREQNPRVPSGALLREVYRNWATALEAAGIEAK